MTDSNAEASADETAHESPAAQGPTARPPLSRPVEDKVIGGVAAGIARHYGWDPLMVRIAFVLLIFVGGAGIFAYLAGLVMLPKDGDRGAADVQTYADLQSRGVAFWAGIVLLVIAILGLLGDAGLLGTGIPVAIALVAIGIAVWKSGDWAAAGHPATVDASVGRRGTAPPAASGPPVSSFSATDVDTRPVEIVPGGPASTAHAPPTAPTPPRPRAPKSFLGRIVAGLALLATAVAIGLDRSGALDLSAVQVMAVPLIVLGTGLFVGTWVGRARWLFFPALALTFAMPIAAFGSEFDVDLASGIGERNVTIQGLPDEGEHRLGIGQLTIDLGEALDDEPAGTRLELEATLGLGEMLIELPDDPDVGYEITATVRYGEINHGSQVWRGNRPTHTFTRDARGGAGTIVVDATVSAGHIELVD